MRIWQSSRALASGILLVNRFLLGYGMVQYLMFRIRVRIVNAQRTKYGKNGNKSVSLDVENATDNDSIGALTSALQLDELLFSFQNICRCLYKCANCASYCERPTELVSSNAQYEYSISVEHLGIRVEGFKH
eukprot:scaffold844_cov268-Chaetoceros_neogracile.AAC.21